MSKIIRTPSNSPLMGRIDTLVNELCPEGVEMVKLGDVCSAVFAGGTPSTSRDDYYDGTIPWIRSGEIDFNRIFNAERNITDLGLANSSAKLIKPFSVVMAMTGATVAKVATVEIETSANQSVCALETNKDNMDYRYLYYYLSAHYHDIKSSAQGALTSLNLQMIKALQIPLPPLSIQQKIVSVLDSFTTLIDKMKQEVEKRKKQMEYYREKLLTFKDDECEWKTLGICCQIFDGIHQTPKYKDSGVKFVSVEDIDDLYASTKYISQEDYESQYKNKPQKSDILMTRIGSVGRCSIVSEDTPIAFYVSLALLRTNKTVLPKYIRFYLESCNGATELRKHTLVHAVPLKINLGDIGKVRVPIPSLEKQAEIVSTLDMFESYITKLEKMIVLRQKQYEYYREQLLTFRPIPSL